MCAQTCNRIRVCRNTKLNVFLTHPMSKPLVLTSTRISQCVNFVFNQCHSGCDDCAPMLYAPTGGEFRKFEVEDCQPWQRLNHFPKTNAICKKDCLARILRKMVGVYGRTFNFMPQSFILPKDKDKFREFYEAERCDDSVRCNGIVHAISADGASVYCTKCCLTLLHAYHKGEGCCSKTILLPKQLQNGPL